MNKNQSPRVSEFDIAVAEAQQQFRAGDTRAAFALLERAHVLGQRDFGRHVMVHLSMLRVAWAMKDNREVRGQLLRLFLVPLGHLTGRLPRSNTGRSNVSAFAPMSIPPELARLLDDDNHHSPEASS
jgi:hypothetical protein